MQSGRCSFCGLRRSEVDALVAGPAGVAICTACAALAGAYVEAVEPPSEKVYRGLSSVVTNDSRNGPGLGQIEDPCIVVRGAHIAWLGRRTDLPARYHDYATVECDGRMASPGFIDAGTEFTGRMSAQRPDPDRLIVLVASQIDRALAHGVTGLDVRVGGSGDPTVDTVLLAGVRAASEISENSHVDITWNASRKFGIEQLDGVMAPTVGRIASSVEMSCDGGADAADLRSRLATLRRLPVRVRLCEASPRACAELAEGARSVEARTWRFLPSDTTPIVEPLVALDGEPVDARGLWDAGGRPAIATRSNPDQRQVNGLTMAISLLVTAGGLSVAEALWSATRGGAMALGRESLGRLRMGDPADMVILDTDNAADLVRRPDENPVWSVIAGGVNPWNDGVPGSL